MTDKKADKTLTARDCNRAIGESLKHLLLALESGTPLNADEKFQCAEIANHVGKARGIAAEGLKAMEMAGVKPNLKVGFFAGQFDE